MSPFAAGLEITAGVPKMSCLLVLRGVGTGTSKQGADGAVMLEFFNWGKVFSHA